MDGLTPDPVQQTIGLGLALFTSAAVGLLVGLERERNPAAKAGLRTFALIALLGTLAAMLAAATGSGWIVAFGVAVVGGAVAAAYLADQRSAAGDAGMTTVIAAMVVFCLGAINFHGYHVLTVAVGIGMTALLHFKTELEGAARRLTPQDIRSVLQFGAVSAVILPLLPDRSYGPYGALNPYHIWLMVVLISGVSLAGYVAWRLAPGTRGLVLTGVLGGVVSSTATSFAYARHARRGTLPAAGSLTVIAIANGTMLARVLLIVLVVAPGAGRAAAIVLVPALFVAALLVAARQRSAPPTESATEQDFRNPANLPASMLFGLGYAVMLVLAAWFSLTFGTGGVYALAVVSGLTDVDAITLSSLRLFERGTLTVAETATAIAIGVGANLAMKAVLVSAIAGRSHRQVAATVLLTPALGLAAGWLVLHALT